MAYILVCLTSLPEDGCRACPEPNLIACPFHSSLASAPATSHTECEYHDPFPNALSLPQRRIRPDWADPCAARYRGVPNVPRLLVLAWPIAALASSTCPLAQPAPDACRTGDRLLCSLLAVIAWAILRPAPSAADRGALVGVRPAGKRRLAPARCRCHPRLRSRSAHRGAHQPALRHLCAAPSHPRPVDSAANRMATARHRARCCTSSLSGSFLAG